MEKVKEKTTAKAKTMNFDEMLNKLIGEVNSIMEPQDKLHGELAGLNAALQGKISEVQELTLENTDVNIEQHYDEIKKLEKQINIVKLKLKAFPDEVDRDLKSVLQRAYSRPDSNGLISLAESTLDTGISEMTGMQTRVDELVKKTIPGIQEKLIAIAEEVGNLERDKVSLAGKLLDLDSCFPREKRKRPHPKPCVSWSDVVVDEDMIGKAFGSEIPAFKWVPGESLGIK